MNKLLYAGLLRALKEKTVWIECISAIIFLVVSCMNQYLLMLQFHTQYFLDNFLFGFLIYIGIFLSIFTSLFVGREYSDRTLRNKIISGHTRTSIYLSNYLITTCISIIFVFISILVTFAIGIPMFGFLKMSAIQFILQMLASIIICLAYAAIFNLIAMIVPNRTYSAIGSILLAMAILPLSLRTYNLFGETSDAFLFITIFRNTIKIAESDSIIAVLCICCIFIILITNAIGIYIFRKKDIK